MLETRLKIVFLFVVLFLASIPFFGILRGTTPTPKEDSMTSSEQAVRSAAFPSEASPHEEPIGDEMVPIPAGPFTRGTTLGGYDERPERLVHLSSFLIDRFEVTTHQYGEFVAVTGQRKPSPPSRYAKNLTRMRGANQPVVYVSWHDAVAYCRWKRKRLPTEAEWEKAMRGTDARLWPWGNRNEPGAANYARIDDGFEVSAPAGSFAKDFSPYGVADGAGNVMEWVADWYGETSYGDGGERDPQGPARSVFKVLRGGGYTTTGSDFRITSRSKMIPNFRDETIGFRCAVSDDPRAGNPKGVNLHN